MDFADKLDMMDDDCDIQGFSLYSENTEKQEKERAEKIHKEQGLYDD